MTRFIVIGTWFDAIGHLAVLANTERAAKVAFDLHFGSRVRKWDLIVVPITTEAMQRLWDSNWSMYD